MFARSKYHWLILILFLTSSAASNEAVFLALEGDGAASIVIEEEAHRAFVIDGGHAGPRGIMGSVVGSSDPLGSMLARGVRELFIVCSHPHRDHMSGLISLLTDPRISDLQKLAFFDNDYERRTGREGLLTIFNNKGRSGDDPGGSDGPRGPAPDYRVVHGKLPVNPDGNGGINVELYGGMVGADEHDRAIISTYTIRDADSANTVVDFDDASTKLIGEWSRETEAQPHTVVLSHHGSKYNYRRDILDAHPSVRDIVIAVNDTNQFFHPSPEVLLDVVERLGPEHVFITRSLPGDNVRVLATGVATDGDNRSRLSAFVALQLDRHAANLERLKEIANAKLTQEDARTIRQSSSPTLTAIELLVERHEITSQLGSRFKRSLADIPRLAEVQARVAAKPQKTKWNEIVSTYQFVEVPQPRLDSSNGTPGYFTKQSQLQDAASGSNGNLASSNGLAAPGTAVGAAAGGGYVASVSGGGGTGQSGSGARVAGNPGVSQGPGGGGGIIFRTELDRPSPIFGGVILGNQALTPKPNDLQFVVQTTPDGEVFLTIRVTTDENKIGEYANFTPGELWSAYQFVQPTEEYLSRYPEAISNSAGLVGIDGRFDTGWKFALHPAVANTTIAVAAMRVDMFLAALSMETIPPDYAKDLPGTSALDLTWQWFDTTAQFIVDGQRLLIKASGDPRGCLMRVRIIEAEPPEWMDPADIKGSTTREVERRVGELLASIFREINPDVEPPTSLNAASISDWVAKAAGGNEEHAEGLLGALALSRYLVANLLRNELDSQPTVSDAKRMTPYLESICDSYQPLRKIDRLAKLVALLNWYRGATGRLLPDLPATVEPTRTTVPNWYPYESVL